MKKTRQQQLTRWLKTQSSLAQRWLRLSMLLGLFSGLLIVAQAWLLASLLHALIIEHTPREQLIPSFIWLAACVRAAGAVKLAAGTDRFPVWAGDPPTHAPTGAG
jgi:ABC-type transport system involved in cytochrome bd biosynthesis, ATPase and permease components